MRGPTHREVQGDPVTKPGGSAFGGGGHTAAAYARFRAEYLGRWQDMLEAWRDPPRDCMVWLMYAANYLFATRGVRWALDPFRPTRLLRDLPAAVPCEPLKDLAFVLLTHNHSDHCDWGLLAELSGTDALVVVPEHLLDVLVRQAPLPERQIVTARAGQPLVIRGIRVEPFGGWHWEERADGRRIGVDSTGYLVECDSRRWLFPGDVRSYSPDALRPFAPIDTLFAHVWLGRGCAEQDAPPLVDAFCDFMLGCAPRSVVLAHLYEFSRSSEDLWHQRHLEMIRQRWRARGLDTPLRVPAVGEGMAL